MVVYILKKEWFIKNGYLNKEEEEYVCICIILLILKVYRFKLDIVYLFWFVLFIRIICVYKINNIENFKI